LLHIWEYVPNLVHPNLIGFVIPQTLDSILIEELAIVTKLDT